MMGFLFFFLSKEKIDFFFPLWVLHYTSCHVDMALW